MGRACSSMWIGLVAMLPIAACSAIVAPDPSRLGGGAPIDAAISPDAGPPAPCPTPGARESLACGACGSLERFCTAEGVWANGPCLDEGECAPGTTGSERCGRCGTQPSRCSASCEWEPTGSCEDEGVCEPGTRTRSGDGCPAGATREVLCSDACEYQPQGECAAEECTTPGTTERQPCGNCGNRARFCTSAGVWEYGACEGEGVCAPGTSEMQTCGRCGTRTARCTEMCAWSTSDECGDEGECAPGEVRRSSSGCSGGQTRAETCSPTCRFEASGDCMRSSVDVMLLLDVTGSHAMRVIDMRTSIERGLVGPLLAAGDVAVGVSYYADFPVSPFGMTTDRPFAGGIEPTTMAGSIGTSLLSAPRMNGGDLPESTVEALSVLTGGTAPMLAMPLLCSSSRVAGGCWRPGARRVIVVYTDATSHNGPDPAGAGLYSAYTGTVGPNARWPDVAERLRADDVELIFLHHVGNPDVREQIDEMLTDLGQPTSNRIDATTLPPALTSAVDRIRMATGL